MYFIELNENLRIQLEIKSSVTAWRGWFINDFTFLEIIITEYLKRYFCQDEGAAKDLMDLILVSNVNFEAKRFAFDFILRKNNPDIIKAHPKIKDDLIEFMQYRNIFAHYMVDTSEKGFLLHKEKKLGFVKFSHKENQNVIVSDEMITELINRINKYIAILGPLIA